MSHNMTGSYEGGDDHSSVWEDFFRLGLSFEIDESGKAQLKRTNHKAVDDGIDHGCTVEQYFENIL